MATRNKMTPFARFLLVLLFLIPTAFFVATYVNGEDPIAKAKEIIGMESAAPATESYERASTTSTAASNDLESLQAENAKLRRQVQELEAKLKQYESDDSSREKWGN